METHVCLTGNAAAQALNDSRLVPPRRGPQFIDGETAALRDSMARFSAGSDHQNRRATLLELLGTIDLVESNRLASEIVAELNDGRDVDLAWLSWHVPTYVLATQLGLEKHREAVRSDVETIARVIGRNEPSSVESDAAAGRLLSITDQLSDPTAAVSLLYQNHDATAGLIRSMAKTNNTAAAAGTTIREASDAIAIDEVEISAGESVSIDLTGMAYGAGAHACPGEALAVAIAEGVVSPLMESTGFETM